MQREPGFYEIIVESHIDKKRICERDEVSVTHSPEGYTVLGGEMDRSALNAVLKRIGDLGLTLISVKRQYYNGGNGDE